MRAIPGSKAIVTMCVGDWLRLGEITVPYLRHYSKRVGADLIILDTAPECHIHYAKWQISRMGYSRYVWIDLDCLVLPSCPDIFAEVPEDAVGAYDESINHGSAAAHRRNEVTGRWMGQRLDVENYFNCGVLHIPGAMAERLVAPPAPRPGSSWPEQDHFNALIHVTGQRIHRLDQTWNCMWMERDRDPHYLKTAKIIHYSQGELSKKISDCNEDIWRLGANGRI